MIGDNGERRDICSNNANLFGYLCASQSLKDSLNT